MMSLSTYKRREDLLYEIFHTLHEMPELHQRIFVRNHYNGQSPEAISRIIHLDVKEVNEILRQCDRSLHSALREFRADSGCIPPLCESMTTCSLNFR
jgi:DNA-directed RNA polymerase specialized sigma24 family protein